VQRFRDGLVVKAHRLLYQSTLELRVIKKREDLRDVGNLRRGDDGLALLVAAT